MYVMYYVRNVMYYACVWMYVMHVMYAYVYVWNISHGPFVKPVTATDSRREPNV